MYKKIDQKDIDFLLTILDKEDVVMKIMLMMS